MNWDVQFTELFRRCLGLYQGGNSDFMSYYSEEDLSFLSSIGYKPQELFDFVEDLGDDGVPTESTAVLIAAVRRDYFLIIQEGEASSTEITSNDVPAREAELGGIEYLPRIIAKAHAKLRGELDPDLMFSCGGDRKFLSENKIHAADFLRHVWAADGDEEKMVSFVKSSTGK